MTESEWQTSTDAVAMVQYLKGKTIATHRKLGLLACAMLRRLPSTSPTTSAALEVAERFLDKLATDEERRAAGERFEASQGVPSFAMPVIAIRTCFSNPIDVYMADQDWWHTAHLAAACAKEQGIAALAAEVLRDLFPTPLIRRLRRLRQFESSWRASNGTSIARAMHEDGLFDRLPILADALEEAGCTNAEILTHCRGPDPHVRGCWVIDGILAKD